MSEERPRRTSGSAGIIALVVGLPLIYVLSIGPFFWVRYKGYIPQSVYEQAMKTLYAPVLWLAKTPLKKPLWAYLEWWTPRSRQPF